MKSVCAFSNVTSQGSGTKEFTDGERLRAEFYEPRMRRHVCTNHKCVSLPGPSISAKTAVSPGKTTKASSFSPDWSQLEIRAVRAVLRWAAADIKSPSRKDEAGMFGPLRIACQENAFCEEWTGLVGRKEPKSKVCSAEKD